MRNLRRHTDTLTQRGVRVNRLADVDAIGTHLDGQSHFTNHVAGMRADHAAAQDLAVAIRLRTVVKQQLGDTYVTAIGNRAAGGGPGGRSTQATSGSVQVTQGII